MFFIWFFIFYLVFLINKKRLIKLKFIHGKDGFKANKQTKHGY